MTEIITLTNHGNGIQFAKAYDTFEAEDVIPGMQATWESKPADNGWKDVSCSRCGFTINVDVHYSVDYNYCPYCGAKMEW